MLEQNADEAFERAEHGAVQHHRRDLVRVIVDIKRAQSPRQVEIDLHGTALPVAADRIAQDVFELRPVERAFSLIDGPRAPGCLERREQRCLRLLPNFIAADALLRPVGKLDAHFLKAEVLVDREDEIIDLQRLLSDLVFRDEHVRVVLGEGAHAHQTVQRT